MQNLNQDGSVDGIYVVNAYLLDKETDIVDYGKYDSVKNLTTDAEINKKGIPLPPQRRKGKFFYQGNLKTKELPWEISIDYYLDGGRKWTPMSWPDRTALLKLPFTSGKRSGGGKPF